MQKGILLEKDLMGCKLPILVCLLKGGQEPGGTTSDMFEAQAFDGRTSAKFRMSLSACVALEKATTHKRLSSIWTGHHQEISEPRLDLAKP